jgi:Protein of unknown function (DUF1269)/Sulfatase
LASVAVGAVAGGLVGKFVDHRLEQEIHDKIGESLPPGSAGIIAVFDDEQRLGVEQALGGSLLKSVVQSDKEGVSALKDSLAEAMGSSALTARCSRFPIGSSAGRSGARWAGRWPTGRSSRAGGARGCTERTDLSDRRRGVRPAGNVWRAGKHPEPDARPAGRCDLQPVPRDRAVLADAGGDADGAQSSRGRLRPGPFPGYTAARPRTRTALPRILQENGYVTGGFGKWHLTPDNVQGPAGPFDHWPQSWGFDHYWCS